MGSRFFDWSWSLSIFYDKNIKRVFPVLAGIFRYAQVYGPVHQFWPENHGAAKNPPVGSTRKLSGSKSSRTNVRSDLWGLRKWTCEVDFRVDPPTPPGGWEKPIGPKWAHSFRGSVKSARIHLYELLIKYFAKNWRTKKRNFYAIFFLFGFSPKMGQSGLKESAGGLKRFFSRTAETVKKL